MELKLSRQDGSIPVTLTTPSGIQLILGGKIDRVDLYEENGTRYIRVIDYKTGKKEFDLGKLLYGVDMQMLLYLFSITEPRACCMCLPGDCPVVVAAARRMPSWRSTSINSI